MTTLNLANIRGTTMARDAESKLAENREKAMILYAFQLLLDKGYLDTATCLASEVSLNLEQYSICENIDLRSIFVDFESYYNLRFQRQPQYFKKTGSKNTVGESLLSRLQNPNFRPQNGRYSQNSNKTTGTGTGASAAAGGQNSPELLVDGGPEFSIGGGFVGGGRISGGGDCSVPGLAAGEKLIKPISGLSFASDDHRLFAESIQKDIVLRDLGTSWADVIGLTNAKTILRETLLHTREFVQFFGNSLPPWTALLLYGPPGTGKTLLAKCVASECKSTFFNISSSSILSKWRGDSEKIVKTLFDLARFHAPSTIFFDEFDALSSKRDTPGETEASRRLKSEILQQMDGLLARTNGQESQIFILAATNLPWELDPAILRRMEKRIYVPLPSLDERKEIFKLEFGKTAQTVDETSAGRNSIQYQIDLDFIGLMTEGYSGSDIHQIAKESVIQSFRLNVLNNNDTSCKSKSKSKHLLIQTEDIMEVIKCTPPTVKSSLNKKFEEWVTSFKPS